MFASVVTATSAIGSKSALSLGRVTMIVLPLFFGVGATFVVAHFMLCSNSDLTSELYNPSLYSDIHTQCFFLLLFILEKAVL